MKHEEESQESTDQEEEGKDERNDFFNTFLNVRSDVSDCLLRSPFLFLFAAATVCLSLPRALKVRSFKSTSSVMQPEDFSFAFNQKNCI